MISIGLISDTHLDAALPDLLRVELARAFAEVSLILHAGDIYRSPVLDELEQLAPVAACAGFSHDRLLDDPRVKPAQVIAAEGLRVGLFHGLDYPPRYPNPSLSRMMALHLGGPVDVLVHGDSHVPLVEWFEGVLLVNPGSATLPHNCFDRPGTVAVLTIDGRVASARILSLAYPVSANA